LSNEKTNETLCTQPTTPKQIHYIYTQKVYLFLFSAHRSAQHVGKELRALLWRARPAIVIASSLPKQKQKIAYFVVFL
jgi:hypothetical protein